MKMLMQSEFLKTIDKAEDSLDISYKKVTVKEDLRKLTARSLSSACTLKTLVLTVLVSITLAL